MKPESFIARRYLRSKHSLNFITIISYLSTAGISLGVAALIVVLSVFNGFSSLVTSFFISFDPHVSIEAISPKGLDKMPRPDTLLNDYEDLVGYTPFVTGKVLIMKGKIVKVATLKGIDIERANNVYGIKEKILFGQYDLSDSGRTPKIILGLTLADRLQSVSGDQVTIISPSGIEESIVMGTMPQSGKFIISGIFYSRNNDYDQMMIFTDIKTATRLLGYGKKYRGFELRIQNPDKAEEIKASLLQKLNGQHFAVKTWYDLHRELFTMMKIERWVAYILLSLIILVSTFNILASLSMSVVEKRRDIGILSAMGMPRRMISRIFLLQGFFAGLTGTIIGYLLGIFVYWLQKTFVLYPLDPTRFKVNALPMELRITDFILVGLSTLLLSTLAALLPARKAASIEPLEAIRWE